MGVFLQGWNKKTCLYWNKLLCVGSSLCPCLRTALFDKSEVCVIPSSLFFFSQGHSGCVNCLEWNEKGE